MPYGYRSATEYRFDEDQVDAIIRTAAYHRKDFCLSVIWFSPAKHVNIRQSIATPFQQTSSAGLGSLDRLPLELLHDTLLRLDVYSLFKFRQTNRRSREAVDSLKQYQMIVLHGLNLFCALLRTRLAVGISLLDFYNALCLKSCSLCGEFGGFMSLLTWKRCCFKCLKEAPETQVQTLSAARKEFHLTKVDLSQLKSFKILSGIFDGGICTREPQTTGQVYATSSERRRKFNFMGSCALPYYEKVSGNAEHGISCAGCQLALEKDIIGSKGEKWASESRDKVYARDGFLEHFKWCEQAQLLWESSCEGNRRPAELPEGARRGGYFSESV
ncbi:uncharacterized protein FFUJ_06378 [Fusarium fujikuroi IMI 58289]|uniref:F-box domain-containing protein n=1 Tax=Gibberella fujikuroi (strain CBS 195.34 / IMI 58289 / NRRL A-6831) TaxID=1279085 RepID=S0E9G8_GIBF5|nr:uncharacterized protein FFUJ_06378 [Fusarium fujikuroi IMI 58289]CCT70407.1 uncharacterized protein FFUJ_06378 [Fusarium fujikuroi IMI 58289]